MSDCNPFIVYEFTILLNVPGCRVLLMDPWTRRRKCKIKCRQTAPSRIHIHRGWGTLVMLARVWNKLRWGDLLWPHLCERLCVAPRSRSCGSGRHRGADRWIWRCSGLQRGTGPADQYLMWRLLQPLTCIIYPCFWVQLGRSQAMLPGCGGIWKWVQAFQMVLTFKTGAIPKPGSNSFPPLSFAQHTNKCLGEVSEICVELHWLSLVEGTQQCLYRTELGPQKELNVSEFN